MMNFQTQKIADVGTENPIVAGIAGLADFVQMAQIDKIKKEKINNCCFEIMLSLIEAEKAAKPLIEEIKEIIKKLDLEGVKIQKPGGTIETPGVMNLAAAKVFLKFAKQSLRSLAQIMGIVLDKGYSDAHFHKIAKDVENIWGVNHPVAILLKQDQDWIKELIDLRNEDEHPKKSNTFDFVRGFNIIKQPDGKYLIRTPCFFDGQSILEVLEVFSQNLLTFSEEIVALSMQTFFPEGVVFTEVPEEKRDPKMPIRFRLGLKDGLFR